MNITNLKRKLQIKFNKKNNWSKSNNDRNPSKLSRVSANKFNQSIENRTKRLAHKLDKIILVLLLLIVITFLILFFVNF